MYTIHVYIVHMYSVHMYIVQIYIIHVYVVHVYTFTYVIHAYIIHVYITCIMYNILYMQLCIQTCFIHVHNNIIYYHNINNAATYPERATKTVEH